MMALLISARGRYKNECKDIALPRYPTAGTLENTKDCHHGDSHAGDPTAMAQGMKNIIHPEGRHRGHFEGDRPAAICMMAWAALGLAPPQLGFQWVRYGPDPFLVNVSRASRDAVYGLSK